MKIIGLILVLASLGIAGSLMLSYLGANNEYNNEIGNYWTLSDRSSDIATKSENLDKFVEALEKSGLQGTHNALWYQNPSNSFDENLKALKSLQARMHGLVGQDETTTQYQMAMQQITGQEQGEASEMISVLEGCWWKVNHPVLWNSLISLVILIGAMILFCLGLVFLSDL